jgi:hypothetical protein
MNQNKQSDCNNLESMSGEVQEDTAISLEGRYLYCVFEVSDVLLQSNAAGIDEEPVYAVSYRDIAALVHNCKLEAYSSSEEKQAIEWVLCHEKVVEAAMSYYTNVLPFAFNTIIKGKPGEEAAVDSLLHWLDINYNRLKNKLETIRGKKEYIVKAFLDCRLVAVELMNTHPELKALQEQVDASSKGKAFLLKGKIEPLLKQKMAGYADKVFHDLYTSITAILVEYKVEKIKPVEKEQLMLLNLSCLADTNECEQLGRVLDEFDDKLGITISFSGPWPPYSFV